MPPILLFLLQVFAVVGATWLVSRALTALSIRLAHRNELLATPNERSSHTVPTPRVGGIGLFGGLAIAFLIAAACLAIPERMPVAFRASGHPGLAQLAGFFVSVMLAFALGFWDDRHDTPAFVKLLGQVAVSIIPPVAGLHLTRLSIPFAGTIELQPLIGIPLTMLWILVLMNVVNFMDGINGLAGRFAQVVALATFASTALFAGGALLIPLSAGLYGAAWGFLDHNFPKAETFMGDCGSQPLGVYIALLGVIVAESPFLTPLPFLGFVIIVSPFLFDVSFTLVRRLRSGENLLEAHREHLYQRHLIASGEDHVASYRFVEGHLAATAILGTVYLYLLAGDGYAAGQLAVLALAGAVLAHYALKVSAMERARAGAA